MKKIYKALARGGWKGQSAIIATLLAASTIQSQAQTFTLSARNTSIQIDVAGGTPGVSDWQVNNVSQLDQQWFYYSVGSGNVNPIDSVGTFSFSENNSGNTPSLTQTYSNSTALVTTSYVLQSQPVTSGQAKLATTLGIENLTGITQTFHLYQFSDFDLADLLSGQTVQFLSSSPTFEVIQTGSAGGPMTGLLTSVSTGVSVEEIAGIEDGNQFGLGNNVVAPVFNNNPLMAGPGPVDYAYEFDATLAPGSAITISEIQTVPEPSEGALIFSGLLVFGVLCGRKLVFFKKDLKKIIL